MSADHSRLICVPETAKVIGKGILIMDTDQYSSAKTSSGLILATTSDQDFEKKYGLGEVLAVGGDVKEVKVGDIVLYQISTAFRIPQGINPQKRLFRITETDISVIAVLPNDPSTAIDAGQGVCRE